MTSKSDVKSPTSLLPPIALERPGTAPFCHKAVPFCRGLILTYHIRKRIYQNWQSSHYNTVLYPVIFRVSFGHRNIYHQILLQEVKVTRWPTFKISGRFFLMTRIFESTNKLMMYSTSQKLRNFYMSRIYYKMTGNDYLIRIDSPRPFSVIWW